MSNIRYKTKENGKVIWLRWAERTALYTSIIYHRAYITFTNFAVNFAYPVAKVVQRYGHSPFHWDGIFSKRIFLFNIWTNFLAWFWKCCPGKPEINNKFRLRHIFKVTLEPLHRSPSSRFSQAPSKLFRESIVLYSSAANDGFCHKTRLPHFHLKGLQNIASSAWGSQWDGGLYGYRLKFWLFYGYRLIFFSYG